jgi:hypothetical protein
MAGKFNERATSRFIRVSRWIFYMVMAVSIALILVKGWQHSRNPYVHLEWMTYFIGSTGNFALYLLERRRKTAEL